MNPFFISSIMSAIRGLKRVCPRCRHAQIVSSDKKDRTVRCSRCGAHMPPRHNQGPRT